MECVILAGGFGTRLKHLLNNKPKSLAPINDRPFLSYLIESLKSKKVDKFIFSLGYLSDQVINFLEINYENLDYEFVIDPLPLGTGGAIRLALEKCYNESILIVNADTFFDIDLGEMFLFHHAKKSDCTFALKPLENYNRYGTVELDFNARIKKFTEKKRTKKGLINGGYLILKKELLIEKFNSNIEFSFEKDFIEIYLDELNAFGFISNEYFIDIGVTEDYVKSQADFKKLKI